VRAGQWNTWSPAFMVGTQVTGKRFGIVGMGRVGQVVAKRARGFDMEIHYTTRRRLEPKQEAGAIFHESVEALLPHCDVLSLHCPSTPQTQNLMNAERIALLPDGAILVNTARGAIVDEAALMAALRGQPELKRSILRLSNSSIHDLPGEITEVSQTVAYLGTGALIRMVVTLIAPIAMEDGLRFAIREGGRTVGAGVVAKIFE